ncbi:hypothetical protein AVEN_89031-1 [Araneus ventricosus]|uniref:HTH CENPB-type domain-containing protein n=1 Tax=Araneus ventricosus TaxID=182803 RepID=A0A4Y2HFW9_ARAVE|nr:hypothetical protein AVEN_89031-1 [Araneus ventricosus]
MYEKVYIYKEKIVREHLTGPQHYPDNGLVSGTRGEVSRNQEVGLHQQFILSSRARAFLKRDALKGMTRISMQLLEDVERLLLIWIHEKQLRGDNCNENIICEKVKVIFADIVKETPESSTAEERISRKPFRCIYGRVCRFDYFRFTNLFPVASESIWKMHRAPTSNQIFV